MGEFASAYQDLAHRGLKTARVEADEIWAFVGAKQRRAVRPGDGDIWTFTAVDADSKLMLTWLVGGRTQENAITFRRDLRSRLTRRIQLTTDGHGMYLTAVRSAFQIGEIDDAMLVRSTGRWSAGWIRRGGIRLPSARAHRRFARSAGRTWTLYVFRGAVKPDAQDAEPPIHPIDQRFQQEGRAPRARGEPVLPVLQLLRPHQTLTKAANGTKTTPAMASGLTDRVWTVRDIVALMDPEAARIE